MIDQLDVRIRDAIGRSVADAPAPPSDHEVEEYLEMVSSVVPLSARPRRGGLSLVLAGGLAAAVIAGLVVIAWNRPAPVTPAAETRVVGWVALPDPDGVFVTAPGIATAPADDGVGQISSRNEMVVSAIERTSHGLIAVGHQSDGFATTGAAWQSLNGVDWHRLADDGAFGSLTNRDDPATSGSQIVDVADFGGRLVAVGSMNPAGMTGGTVVPAAWLSDDALTWSPIDLGSQMLGRVPTGWMFTSVTATQSGWVAIMTNAVYDSGKVNGAVEIWTSANGQDWTETSLDTADALAGTIVQGPTGLIIGGIDVNGRATIWNSVDGSTWQRTELATAGLGSITQLLRLDGVVVAIGAERSGPVGYGVGADGFELTGTDQVRIWTSTDGSNWQPAEVPVELDAPQQWVTSAASGAGGVLAAVRTMQTSGAASWTLSTADGYVWRATPAATPGSLNAIVSTDSGWIAASTGATSRLPAAADGTDDSRNTVILLANLGLI